MCDKVYITHVEKQFPVDAYFPVQTFHDEGFKQIRYDFVLHKNISGLSGVARIPVTTPRPLINLNICYILSG